MMESTVYEALIAAALRFISFRPRSEKEIRIFLETKLKKSRTTAPIVLNKVLFRLRELGYVDDTKFAEWWINQRTGRKPKGRRIIEQELKRKGIDTDIHIEEKELARRAVQKKREVWKRLSVQARKKKLSDFLYRRGFDWDTISGIIGEANEKD